MRLNEQVRRWRSIVTAGAVLVAAVITGQVAGATPASAVSGLQVVRAISSIDSLSTKSATAYCPAGKRVIGGGGGLVWDLQHHTRQVVITRMQPVHPISGPDSFIVTGEETSTGTTDNWWLDAYAVCADPLPGMRIAVAFSGLSSLSVQLAQAECRAGEQVIGSGAYVYNSGGQVGLQVMRASTTAPLAYAQAHEDADGYAGSWYVAAFAVCAEPIPGYEIVHGHSPEEDSEAEKAAWAQCPAGKRVHGAGGAVAFSAPGHVSLTRILVDPYGDGRQVASVAAENTSTSLDWGFIVAQAICAY